MTPIVIDAANRVRDAKLLKYAPYLFRDRPRKASAVVKANVDDEPNYCLEGLIVETNTPIANRLGRIIAFDETAFDEDIASGNKPPVWIGHDENNVVGYDTELCAVNVGVAFRFVLPNTAQGLTLKKAVLSGEQNSISIGYTELEARDEMHGEHKVRHISRASIREISVLPIGASKKAFCRVIDANREPPLRESISSQMFALEHDLHNIKRLSDDNQFTIRRLKRDLLLLEDGYQDSDEPTTLHSVSDVERIETLQRARRAALGLSR